MNWTAIFFTVVALLWALSVQRKKAKARRHPAIKKPEKNVAYLCQFPPSPGMRSISPFALKLETWLRLTGIRYTNHYTTTFSKSTKQIPYIELNGQELAESNLIIEGFKKMYMVDPDEGLSPEKKAQAHCLLRMVEFHTIQHVFYWRYGRNMKAFYDECVMYYDQSFGMTFCFKRIQPIISRIRAYMNGVGRQPDVKKARNLFADCDALAATLKNENYFLGTSEPTTVDCALFGHLVQFFLIPDMLAEKCPFLGQALRDKYPQLLAFVNRMKDKIWPDWEEMCSEEHAIEYRVGEPGSGKIFGDRIPDPSWKSEFQPQRESDEAASRCPAMATASMAGEMGF